MNNTKKFLFTLLLLITTMATEAQKNDPWMEYMIPADMHKLLEKYTGTFNMEVTMWMMPGKDPAVIHLDSEHTMALGGRFLQLAQKGDMMGMSFEGITTIGYNNTGKNFDLTTITNMGTGILALTGTWNDSTKVASLFGKLVNPVTKKTIQVKQTVSFPDDNTLLIENFDQEGEEKERKSIQYKFTRKKS